MGGCTRLSLTVSCASSWTKPSSWGTSQVHLTNLNKWGRIVSPRSMICLASRQKWWVHWLMWSIWWISRWLKKDMFLWWSCISKSLMLRCSVYQVKSLGSHSFSTTPLKTTWTLKLRRLYKLSTQSKTFTYQALVFQNTKFTRAHPTSWDSLTLLRCTLASRGLN